MKPWKLFTAYTPEYKDCVGELYGDCIGLNLVLLLYPYESKGNWRINTQSTVLHTLNALEDNKGINLVWVDADARVMKYPALFDVIDSDIGAHHRKNKHDSKFHWNTGTIYLANNEAVRHLFEMELKYLDDYNQGDLEAYPGLNYMLECSTLKDSVRKYNLPANYSYVFDTRQPEEVRHKDDIVIMHTQASRRLKEIVNQGG